MKLNLLELTQNILSAMDGDEVNSINDTAESRQVAQIIKTTYSNIFSRANLPERQQLFNLDASGSSSQPVLMTRPSDVARIDWIKYDKSEESDEDNFDYVTILPKQQFFDMIHSLDSSETTVDTFTLDGITYYYRNDKHPDYCTIIDDETLIFDSYYSDLDSTLQSSKTLCFGLTVPVFLLSDSYTPELDENQYPLLLNEAKSLAFLEMKQMTHSKAETEARRHWVSLQKNKELKEEHPFNKLANFGRR